MFKSTTHATPNGVENSQKRKASPLLPVLDIKITLAAETPLVIAALEIQLQTKLDVTRGTSCCDCSEACCCDNKTWRAEIRPVEGIEHICLKAQVKALSKIE